ncbi:MAG: SDR family NAD(P)-dependent oxidoreductase [Gemmatimonadales bacterium]
MTGSTPEDRSQELAGRVALVTGAWRGIGRAIAQGLLARGARVAVNVRDADRADEAARSLGSGALAAPGDVRRSDHVARMVGAPLERWGRLDILVNNAAFATATRFPELEEAEWREAMEVNATGPFLTMRAALPAMREAGYGRMVNIGSTASKTVSTLAGAHYTASKHALLGLTRAAARELGPLGITVNAICPGLTDTELVQETAAPGRLEELTQTAVPVRRIGRPVEVADLVCFVASERAGYINGAALDINGGIILV